MVIFSLLYKLIFSMLQTSMVDVVRPCWVSALEPYNGKWYLSEKGELCGQFDAIVIAHNGNLFYSSVV